MHLHRKLKGRGLLPLFNCRQTSFEKLIEKGFFKESVR